MEGVQNICSYQTDYEIWSRVFGGQTERREKVACIGDSSANGDATTVTSERTMSETITCYNGMTKYTQ